MKVKKYSNVLFFHTFNYIGGTESYVYETICKYSKDYDLTVFYVNTKSEAQIERLKAIVGDKRVIKYEEPYYPVFCERAFLNYDIYPFIDYIIADEIIDVVHANLYLQDFDIPQHPKISRYLGVSESVCNGFRKQCKKKGIKNLKIDTCYNPIEIRPQEDKQALLLVSATRLTREKGLERMQVLASELDRQNIPYIWLVFTYEKDMIQNKHVVYMPPTLDIRPFLKMATYVVQLSSSEGYCYTILESLMLGTPVIVTDLETFNEMGIENGKNGYILPLDMGEIPTKDIYEHIPKFVYKKKNDEYKKYLSTGETHYEEVKTMKIKVINPWHDLEERKSYVLPMEYGLSKINRVYGHPNVPIPCVIEVRENRAKTLIKNGLAVAIEKPKRKGKKNDKQN